MSDHDDLVEALSRLSQHQRADILDDATHLSRRRQNERRQAEEKARRDSLPRLRPGAGQVVTTVELRAWGETLWDKHWHTDPRWQNPYWYSESRELEPFEWDNVEAYIAANRDLVICQPHNACMGFGIGVTLYEVQPAPAPGVPVEEQREHICCITSNHLVRCRNTGSPFQSEEREGGFSVGWRLFSLHTHCEVNAKLLEQYGFDPPRDKSHYDY